MASFVYAVWSITNVASFHCAVRPEISPCTCEPVYANNMVELSCEKVDSFHKIVDALSNKFAPNISISLKISHSQLDDLEMRSFMDMKLKVVKLRLQWNNIRSVPELPFRGLSNVEFLSLGDNELEEIPKHVLNHMPVIKTLDMGRGHIHSVLQDDLKGMQILQHLFLPSNNISRLDKGAFPTNLQLLHLGRNQIESLNGTLRDLDKLESLFINMNNIETLENELPDACRLKLILAQNNRLERLPQSMQNLQYLETLHLQYNMLRTFDGVLSNARTLNLLTAFNNSIEYLAKDEFGESENLEELNLSANHIKSLNGSLLPLKKLLSANFSFNDMEEFSMNEIRGLKHLKQLNISYNKIQKLTGRQENNIDQHSFLIEFNLDYNRLKSLDGALMGLNRLRILTLSHNQIERILPEDFIGLERLETLELSHNRLLTLKEMSTTYLPNLKFLMVDFNNLTVLENDFHGLPVLCQANLTNNQITSISNELVSETRCMNHNVPGKLELFLENNPIMCDERLNQLCPLMLTQEARIRGKSQCFNIDLEVCADIPLIITQNLPIIIQQFKQNQAAHVSSNPVIQVIVPSPILLNNNLKKADTEILPIIAQPIIKPLLIAPTISTTTTTTTTAAPVTSTIMPAAIEAEAAANDSNAATLPLLTNNSLSLADIPPNIELLVPAHVAAEQANGAPNILGAPLATITIDEPALEASITTTSTPKAPIISEHLGTAQDPPVVLDIAAAEPAPMVPEHAAGAGSAMVLATAVDHNNSNSNNNASVGLVQHQTEYPTVEYIPNIDQFMPGNRPPDGLDEETNNSVHQEFPSVVLTDMDNAQQSLLLPEEPPENP